MDNFPPSFYLFFLLTLPLPLLLSFSSLSWTLYQRGFRTGQYLIKISTQCPRRTMKLHYTFTHFPCLFAFLCSFLFISAEAKLGFPFEVAAHWCSNCSQRQKPEGRHKWRVGRTLRTFASAARTVLWHLLEREGSRLIFVKQEKM